MYKALGVSNAVRFCLVRLISRKITKYKIAKQQRRKNQEKCPFLIGERFHILIIMLINAVKLTCNLVMPLIFKND